MIYARLNELPAKQHRTFYWLAKETGVSHTTIWLLKKRKAFGINFETLEKYARRSDVNPAMFFTFPKTRPHKSDD